MFGEDTSEIPATHPKQDHVVHFELVHNYIIRFGDKSRSSSLTGDWAVVAVRELEGIAAAVYIDGSKKLHSTLPPHAVYPKLIAYMDSEGLVTDGGSGYDFMAETLLDANYVYEPKIKADQAFIAKLEM